MPSDITPEELRGLEYSSRAAEVVAGLFRAADTIERQAARIAELEAELAEFNEPIEHEEIMEIVADVTSRSRLMDDNIALKAENGRLEKECEEAIEERDDREREVTEIHIALGGDGEWVTRVPPQGPPHSGDCFLDSLALIDELMKQRTDAFIRQAFNLDDEQTRRDAAESMVAELEQQVAALLANQSK